MNYSRKNNFDLIRLLAAIQVMLYHGLTYFYVPVDWAEPLKQIIYLVPGVPIFFTISGFLIYQSLERNNKNLKKYFYNRLLRIYPALWVCLAFTILLLILSKELDLNILSNSSFYQWILAQLTFFQFYNIPELSTWGTGNPNGSLWSISVELQFYCFLPLLFIYFFKGNKSLRFKNIFILAIILISIIYNYYQGIVVEKHGLVGNIMGVFILQYLYFFCLGILIHLNFNYIKKFLIGKAWIWISIFFIFTFLFRNWLHIFENVYETSFLGLIGAIILSLATISAAFSMPNLSSKYLKGNDLSYGIYIYHMPIFNYFYNQKVYMSWQELSCVYLGIIMVAFLSWRVVEKNVLKFKA